MITMKHCEDFQLDLGAVGLKSVEKAYIALPYSGALPDQMSGAKDAVLRLNLQPMQQTSAALVAKLNGGTVCGSLDIPSQQLCDLLEQFFQQKKTGLTPYYLGWWQACYAGWRRSRREPLRYLAPLSELSKDDLKFLISRLDL